MEGVPGSVVSADGTRIGFVTGGAGPALLMVHGGMCSSARWAPLWPLLVGRFRVTALDRRGRGSSGDAARYSLAAEHADVLAVAEHLSAMQGRPVDVFGHSYGAVCALGAAALGAPLRRLALYEPPGKPTVPADWLERVRSMVVRGEVAKALRSFLVDVVGLTPEQVELLRDRAAADRAAADRAGADRAGADRAGADRAGADRVGADNPIAIAHRTLVREAEALSTSALLDHAPVVAQPVLLLLGSASPPWAGAVVQSLADALPAARVELLADQGHEAVDTAPELVAGRLVRFLLDE